MFAHVYFPCPGGMLRPNSPLSPLPPGRIPLRAPVPNLPIRPAAPITPMVPLNPVSTPGAFSGAHGRPVVRPRAQAAPTAPQGPSPSTQNHPNLNNIPPAQRLLAQATSLGDILYRLILHRKIRKLGDSAAISGSQRWRARCPRFQAGTSELDMCSEAETYAYA